MPMGRDFLPFAVGVGANLPSQAAYAADPLLGSGNQPGIARSNFNNKALRQGTFVAAGICEFMTEQLNLYINDDGNLANWVTEFENALKAYAATYGKIFLTADTTYYVATTGSDSIGLGTLANPWATIQHAYDFVQKNFDCSGFNITFQMADGTYTDSLLAGQAINAKTVTVRGNPGTPDNVVLSVSNSNCIFVGIGVSVLVNGLKLQATGTPGAVTGYGLLCNQGGLQFLNVDFGACSSAHKWASATGQILANGAHSITGVAPVHAQASTGGVNAVSGQIITVPSGLNFSTAFCTASQTASVLFNQGTTFTGAGATLCTGSKGVANTNGIIDTGGSLFTPGNSGPTTSSGGQYV